jgi:hypothetical protein
LLSAEDLNSREKYVETADTWLIILYRCEDSIDRHCMYRINRDRAQGCAFLMSCELYISLTVSDFVNDDNPNTTQTLEYTKDKYNMKIRK